MAREEIVILNGARTPMTEWVGGRAGNGKQGGALKDFSAIDLGVIAAKAALERSKVPPDILDTRWSHITNRSKVDANSKAGNKPGDGKERIVLGAGTHKYRHILLWFTTPPSAGPTVRISELSLLA